MNKQVHYGFWKSLLIISTTIVVVFMLIEAVLRFGSCILSGTPFWDLRQYVYDDELCWKMNPGYYGPILGCKKERINGKGFRGKDYSRTVKGENTIRIMIAGDSNTAGWGLPDEDRIYPPLVERELSEKLGNVHKVEVVNLGVVAYSTYQGEILIRRLFDTFSPDIVTIMYGANDALVVPHPDKVGLWPRFIYMNLLEHSTIYNFLKKIIRRANADNIHRRERERKTAMVKDGHSCIRVSPSDYKENILKIADFVSSRGAKLVIITFPYGTDEIITFPYGTDDQPLGKTMTKFRQAIAECQSETGCSVFDFFAIADALPTDSVFINFPIDPIHLTYLGHRVLAENLAEHIFRLISTN